MANITPSLAHISDELLEDIFFHVARSSVIDVASLGKVSRAFRMHWNTEGIRKECNLRTLDFVPVIRDIGTLRSLAVAMTRFCQAGNLGAIFREGITSLLDNKRRERADKGLIQLEVVAEKGHMQATFLYDMILVCTNLKIRDEGFNILSTLMQPTLLETMRRMARLREDHNSNYLAKLEGGQSNVIEILVEYLGDCGCPDPDGNRAYMDDAFGLPFQTVVYDPLNDLLCKQCFWDREKVVVQLYNHYVDIAWKMTTMKNRKVK